MTGNILPKNLHGLNFTRRQFTFIRSFVLIGSQMADLLRDEEIKTLHISYEADKLIKEWDSVIMKLVLAQYSKKS